jgi:CRP/FNR family transcriptional regulator, cyclic AMP receptor protein
MSFRVDQSDRGPAGQPERAETAHSLARCALFAGLSPEILRVLEEASRVRRFPKGQILCSEGDPGDNLIVLEEGQAKICRFTVEGQEIVLSLVNAPAAFGELALIDGAPRSATIVAITPVAVRLIERSTFIDLVEREPEIARGLLQALAAMVRATNERFVDLLTLDVPGRVAKWLLAHAPQQPPVEGDAVPFAISQGDLAAELGATRVSVNRALKTFEQRGCIRLERGCIVLLKPDVLQEQVR